MPPFPVPAMMQGAGAPGMPPAAMGGAGARPQGGTGPAVMPQAMAGANAKSQTQVKTAIEMLQSSLAGLPMGSELHRAVLKAVTEVSKHMEAGPDDQSQIVQQLAQLARSQQQDPQQQQAMQRLFAQNPVAGVSPPPASPQPAEAA